MKCQVCSIDAEIPFRCSFCEGLFCEEHKLPENHNCPREPPRVPLGSWESKQRLIDKPPEQKSKFISEGEFHFVKKELPTFEMPKKKRFRFLKRKNSKS